MEKINSTEKSTNLKAAIGASIFLIIGILLTSKRVNLSENTALLLLQFFLLGLALRAISLNGYYFVKPNNEEELTKKHLLFSIVLIPTALIFFVNQSYKELFFFISFFMSICFVLIHGITFKRKNENYLLTFLTSIWALLGVVIIVKHYNILPARFFNELSFLELDTIQIIRELLLVGIALHITIISSAEAIKPENKILEPNPIPVIPDLTEIDSYYLLLRPLLWLGYLAILFLNIGVFFSNLILGGLRIILDLALRFVLQVINNIIKLLRGWYSIILFILLYIICFSIPFIIKVNSPFLLNYIKGDSSNFKFLLAQVGVLLLAIFFFRLLITFLFCRIYHTPSKDKTLKRLVEDFIETLGDGLIPLNGKTYIENFTPIIYCLVFYSFFISLSSIILTGISNYWNPFFEIQGYLSIGTLTKYCGYLVFVAIIVIISLIISKSKVAKKEIVEEKHYFVFHKLDWSSLWTKPGILILLIGLISLMMYFYIAGTHYKWLYNKSDIENFRTTDSLKIALMEDSMALERKRASKKIGNDSIMKVKRFADRKIEQEKQGKNIPTNVTAKNAQKEEENGQNFYATEFNKILNNVIINIKAQEYDYSIKQLEIASNMNQVPLEYKKQILEIKSFIKAREDGDAIKKLNQIIARK